MGDFILKVTKAGKGDVVLKLKRTMLLSDLIKLLKRHYRVSSLGAFSLQYCNGDVFYYDVEKIDPNCGENETLENFFGNAEGDEIVFVPKTAGSDDVMIGNATDEHLVAKLEYGIINRQPLTEAQTVAVECSVDIAQQTGTIKPSTESTTEYAEKTLEQKPRSDVVKLPPHSSGRKLQVALDKGYSQGTRAVSVCIYREDDLEFKNPITFFKIEQGEIWILYPGLQEREIFYGKAKRMFLAKLFLFSKRQDRWLDIDGQDHDPHACLKERDNCGVCPDRALCNGSMIGDNHRRLLAGKQCRVCENYTQTPLPWIEFSE